MMGAASAQVPAEADSSRSAVSPAAYVCLYSPTDLFSDGWFDFRSVL